MICMNEETFGPVLPIATMTIDKKSVNPVLNEVGRESKTSFPNSVIVIRPFSCNTRRISLSNDVSYE